MIDPITAFATAQAAVAGIKKAVALGKDIQGLIGEFGKFFDARDVVQKAANDLGKQGKSDTAQAMEIVMQAHQLRQAEEELKHHLIYGGYPELWEQMLIQRTKIRQDRERKEREAKVARTKRREQAFNFAIYAVLIFFGLGLAVSFALILMHL